MTPQPKQSKGPSRSRHASRFRNRQPRVCFGAVGGRAGWRWAGRKKSNQTRPPGWAPGFNSHSVVLTRKLFCLPPGIVLWENESEVDVETRNAEGLLLADWVVAWINVTHRKMRFRSGRRTRAVGSTQHAFLVSPSDGTRAWRCGRHGAHVGNYVCQGLTWRQPAGTGRAGNGSGWVVGDEKTFVRYLGYGVMFPNPPS